MQSRGIELSEKSKGKQYIPHGDFVEFKCKVGYAHPAVWSASDCTVRCYSSNVSYPQSYKEICPVLDLENGRIYYSYWRKFREGATTSYSCKRDYSPENEQDRITCTKNGWSPTPRCIPETTCHADHLENGRFHRNYWRTSYKINERITYSCNSENDRENQQRTVTCTKNGWWPTPRCIPGITCPVDNLANGRFHSSYWKTSYKINDRITYSCNSENNRENQQRTVTCTKNGWWPTPRCIPDRTSD
ncbi:complement factor H-like [Alligator mississippiensis]|uniref:complement factor H-like n=1 Tax=Alligator mississippiensis TaxID=8496 RepID=UPI002877D4F8|nr:complement factor H-like [Alligator mississippiensis]XP_059584412.1 complement factor H-like [Alligator mississippiensis]